MHLKLISTHYCRSFQTLTFFSKEGFLSYATSRYKLHFYESPTGVLFIMMTDTSVGNIKETMKKLYSSVSVSCEMFQTEC